MFTTAKDIADSLIARHPSPDDIAEAMQSLSGVANALPRPTGFPPVLIHMLGMPGSGKSFVAKAIQKSLATDQLDYGVVGNDLVMETLPGYRLDCKVNAAAAFSRWETPSRVTGYLWLQAALDRKLSVIYDTSGHDRRHMELLKYIQHLGYRVAMVYPVVKLETAQARVAERGRQPGARYISPEMVSERYAINQRLAGEYRQLLGARFFKVDNDGPLNLNAVNEVVTAILN